MLGKWSRPDVVRIWLVKWVGAFCLQQIHSDLKRLLIRDKCTCWVFPEPDACVQKTKHSTICITGQEIIYLIDIYVFIQDMKCIIACIHFSVCACAGWLTRFFSSRNDSALVWPLADECCHKSLVFWAFSLCRNLFKFHLNDNLRIYINIDLMLGFTTKK